MRFPIILLLAVLGCGDDDVSGDAARMDAARDGGDDGATSGEDGSVQDGSLDADSGTREVDVMLETEAPVPVPETTFYVRVDGDDSEDRDGRTVETAWATLGYACTRVLEGPALVDVGAGSFEESGVIEPVTGLYIRGAGPRETLIRAPASLDDHDGDPETGEGYVLRVIGRDDVVVRGMGFENNAADGAKAAIYLRRANRIRLLDLHIEGFNMAGIVVDRSGAIEVGHSTFIDTAERSGEGVTIALDGNSRAALGALTVIFGDEMRIHHNVIDESNLVGIKGYQINNGSRIFANEIDGREFGLENPHKNDVGLEIFNNVIRQQISVPKNGEYSPGEWPYNVRIHDNYIEVPKGSIEGPRTHLLVDYNTFDSTESGRIYENHGGAAAGPMWMHHNVVLNARHGFFWAETRGGDNDNNQVYLGHNTVFFDDTLDNYIASLGGSGSGQFRDYVVVNNIFSAPASRPASLFPFRTPAPLALSGNLFHEVREDSIPESLRRENVFGDPGVVGSERAWFPEAGGAVVDRGVASPTAAFGREVGHPVRGEAPDIGAFEEGSEQRLPPCGARLGARTPDQVRCRGEEVVATGEAGDWVTLSFEDLARGPYTLRVEVSGDGVVETWHATEGEELVDWNLPHELSAEPRVRWLGEAVIDGTLRLRVRRRSGGTLVVHSVRLIPRFDP